MPPIRFLTVLLLLISPYFSLSHAQDTSSCPLTDPLALTIGESGLVKPGTSNRVRSAPSLSGEVVFQIAGGTVFEVLGGPTCADGYRWWQVSSGGQDGWTVEGDDSEYFLEVVEVNAPTATPAPEPASGDCELAPRLEIGREGRLTTNTPSRLRDSAATTGAQIGQIQPLDTFTILDGPVCSEGINWWQVSVGNLTGWTAEGVGEDYLTELIAIVPTATPAYIGLPNPTSVSWNADGTLLAVGTDDGVYLYDVANEAQPIQQLFAGIRVISLDFVPGTAERLAVSLNKFRPDCEEADEGDTLPNLFIYDIEVDEVVQNLPPANQHCEWDRVRHLQFNTNGPILVMHNLRLTALYDVVEKELTIFETPPPLELGECFDEIAISADGTQAALSCDNTLLRTNGTDEELWLFEDGRITQRITALALSDSGDRIFIGDEVGSLRMYVRPEGETSYTDYQSFIRGERSTTSNRINALAVHPLTGDVITAESDPSAVVRVFEPTGLSQVAAYMGGSTTTAALALDFNADGSLLAVLIDDTVHILDGEDYSLIQVLVLQQN